MNIIPIPGFSEPFSSMSHLFGGTVPFGVWGLFMMWRAWRGPAGWGRLACIAIFVLASCAMLTLSGVYHLLEPGGFAREEVLRRLDHAAIFFLIAGSFTPALGLLFRGWWRWGMLALIWSLAALSITLKSVYFHDFSEAAGLAMYLGLGWLGLISGGLLIYRYGLHFARWLITGALAYTAGAVAEFMGAPVLVEGVIGPHEVFHLAVLLGLFCHWMFVWPFANGDLPASHHAHPR